MSKNKSPRDIARQELSLLALLSAREIVSRLDVIVDDYDADKELAAAGGGVALKEIIEALSIYMAAHEKLAVLPYALENYEQSGTGHAA